MAFYHILNVLYFLFILPKIALRGNKTDDTDGLAFNCRRARKRGVMFLVCLPFDTRHTCAKLE